MILFNKGSEKVVTDIKLERLKDISEEEFLQFGHIIGREDTNKNWVTVTPEFDAYTDIVPGLKNESGRFSVGMLVVREKPEGELILWTEYHEGSIEFLFPLGGRQIVFVLAPPGPEPSLEKTRAFVIGPNEGIMLSRKVWHHPPFALSERTRCLMPRYGDLAERNGILSDRKTVYYGENYRGYAGIKIGEYKIRLIL
jgi:ureidoglycolate hydrolase